MSRGTNIIDSVKPIELGEIRVHLIWFDSLGAKSSSVLLETPEVRILLDPGAAEMQPSYPLLPAQKKALREEALEAIKKAARGAEVVFISHYHYDHHTLPQEAPEIYCDKVLWIKDPNRWINRSQWNRSRLFAEQLLEVLEGKKLEYASPEEEHFEDPLKQLPLASAKDFRDYQQRKKELLKKGRAWLRDLMALWRREPWVPQLTLGSKEILFADGRSFHLGETSIRITPPLFHGAEYDRVGWVVGLVLERRGKKVVYAPDLQGPIIEDYAQWLIRENPDLLILDGPPTYLLGYMLNLINLGRVIENISSILRNTETRIIIYDHHLLREARYREHLARAYQVAKDEGKDLLTAAEWLGEEPLIDRLTGKCSSTPIPR